MPCYVTGTREGDLEMDARESREAYTNLTRLFCSVLNDWQLLGKPFPLSPEAASWWKKHCKVDAKRKKKP